MPTIKKESAFRIPKNTDVSQLIESAKEVFYKDSHVIGVGIGEHRKKVETERPATDFITYWLTIRNVSAQTVGFEAKYSIFR